MGREQCLRMTSRGKIDRDLAGKVGDPAIPEIAAYPNPAMALNAGPTGQNAA
jgi:hypothetical protein